MRQAEIIANHIEDEKTRIIMKELIKKRRIAFDCSIFYLDSTIRSSQKNTPRKIQGTAFYCGETISKKELKDILNITSEDGFIYLPTWTDNRNLNWIREMDTSSIVFHHPSKEVHKKVMDLPDHRKESEYNQWM